VQIKIKIRIKIVAGKVVRVALLLSSSILRQHVVPVGG
jgi:hypothetical protein